MIFSLQHLLYQFAKNERGQDLTEYALLVVFIAIIVVLAVAFFGDSVSSYFSTLGGTVQSWFD
jgi:pilus assembly protein Flp/PilA